MNSNIACINDNLSIEANAIVHWQRHAMLIDLNLAINSNSFSKNSIEFNELYPIDPIPLIYYPNDTWSVFVINSLFQQNVRTYKSYTVDNLVLALIHCQYTYCQYTHLGLYSNVVFVPLHRANQYLHDNLTDQRQ